MKTTAPNKTRKTTTSKMKAKAWKAFTRWYRLSHADTEGNCVCYTCGAVKPWKEMQTGHWFQGHGNATYINPNYVRVQCYSCNVPKKGMLHIYTPKLIEEIGQEFYDFLWAEAHKTVDLTLSDYVELYEQYTKKFNEIDYEGF